MRTQLTINMRQITGIASILCRSIFSVYDKCSGTQKGWYLLALRDALHNSISQMDDIIYGLEFDDLRLYVKSKRPVLVQGKRQVNEQATLAAGKIMQAIRKYVESKPSLPHDDFIKSLSYQFAI